VTEWRHMSHQRLGKHPVTRCQHALGSIDSNLWSHMNGALALNSFSLSPSCAADNHITLPGPHYQLSTFESQHLGGQDGHCWQRDAVWLEESVVSLAGKEEGVVGR
jgi:hypothetical protein